MRYEIQEINYDPELDILELYTEKNDYHSSAESGDFIYHFNSADELVGVEILNASSNLEGEIEDLEKLEKAEIESLENGDKVNVKIELGSGEKSQRITESQHREEIKA